jgi:tetratricopeptide (TPR) repeat protein
LLLAKCYINFSFVLHDELEVGCPSWVKNSILIIDYVYKSVRVERNWHCLFTHNTVFQFCINTVSSTFSLKHQEATMLDKLRRIARSDKSTTSTLEVVGGDQHIVYPDSATADHVAENNEESVPPIDTNDPAAWYHQGNLYRDAQKMEAALSCYYRTAEMQPERQEVWQSIAWTLVALQQLPEAQEVYCRIVEMDPHSPEGWANLGWVQNQLGQHHEALVSIDK